MLSYADYLRLLPKVELHCHLVATIRASTLIELAEHYGVELPSTDPVELFGYDNIVDFLAVFAAATEVYREPAVLTRVAYESVADAVAAGNLRYREYFVNATKFPGMPYPEVMDAVILGLRRAEAEFGVGYGIVAAIDRRDPAGQLELVEAVIANPRPEVLGIGQDYLAPDDTESPELFAAAYELAEAHGINRTAHVAEIPNSTADNVTIAMRDLHCARLDHGYHVMDDPAVVEAAREARIPFNCTPWSTNVLSGWEMTPEHPIAQMIRAGLNVTFSTDDPTFFRTDLGREYVECLPAFGFGPDVAKRISLAGVDACWAPEDVKARLRAEFAGAFRALDAALDPAVLEEYPALV
jgi:adenosine deaminase